MSGETSILREFLVKIGFSTDESKLKKAEANLKKFTAEVGKFAAAMEAAAIAVEAGVVRIASKFEDLYWSSQRLGASAAKVQALGFAFSQLGGSGDQARNVLRSIQDSLLMYGQASEGMLHALGVASRDSNGRLRDTSDILGDLTKRWQGMADKQRAYWEANSYFGIDMDTFQVLMRDTGEFEAQQAAWAKRFGLNMKDASAASKNFSQLWRETVMVVGLFFDKILLKLQAPMQIQLEKFLRWLAANADALADKAISIGTAFINFLTATGELAGRLIGFLQRLDAATDGWSTKILLAAAAWKLLGIGALIKAVMSLAGWIAGLNLEALGAGLVAALSGPLLPILAIGAALVGMLAICSQFRDALVGAFTDAWPAIKTALDGLVAALDQLWAAIQPLLRVLFDLAKRLTDALGPVIVAGAKAALTALVDGITELADGIRIVADLLQGKWADAWRDTKKLAADVGKSIKDSLLGSAAMGGAVIKGAKGALDDRYEGDPATGHPTAKGGGFGAWWGSLFHHKRQAAALAGADGAVADIHGGDAASTLAQMLLTMRQIRDLLEGSPANDTGGGAFGAGGSTLGAVGRAITGAAGWTKAQLQGISAGLYAESRLDPKAVNPTSGAYGIGQWLGRRQRDFATVMGRPLQGSSFEDQAKFLMWELSHTEKRAGDMIRRQSTAQGALAAMLQYYERPGAGLGGDYARGSAYLGAGDVHLHQNTNIHVHGHGANDTAQAVTSAQDQVNNDMVRRARKVVA